jgi:hypothetical protein
MIQLTVEIKIYCCPLKFWLFNAHRKAKKIFTYNILNIIIISKSRIFKVKKCVLFRVRLGLRFQKVRFKITILKCAISKK